MSGTTRNPEQEKTAGKADDLLATAITERLNNPPPKRPGYHYLVIKDPQGKVILEEVDSVPCCGHGGEPIPQGGFRGGAQDIPAGHQSGYGGHSGKAPEQSRPKEDDCFTKTKEAIELGARLHKEGFEQGKNSLANTKGPQLQEEEEENGFKAWWKKNWLSVVALVVIVVLVAYLGSTLGVFASEDVSSHQETEQTEPITTEDMVVSPFTSQDAGDLNQEPQDSPVDVTVLDEQKVSAERVSDEELEGNFLALLNYKDNLRVLPEKLAGENKFVVLASILTLPSGLSEKQESKRASLASKKTGEVLLVNPTEVNDKARNYVIMTEYNALNKKPESIHWWANTYSSAGVPSSQKTAFSLQVVDNIQRIKAILKEKGTSADKLVADA